MNLIDTNWWDKLNTAITVNKLENTVTAVQGFGTAYTISNFPECLKNEHYFTGVDQIKLTTYGTLSDEGRRMVEHMVNKKHYEIDRVIINEPATIIIWKDKTKTVVKCGKNDEFNPEAGIALAYMKRVMFEDKTTQFNKWMNKQTEGYYDSIRNSCLDRILRELSKDKK